MTNMFLNFYIYMFLFILSLLMYSFFYNHVMLNLMSMELVILSLMLMFMMFLSFMGLLDMFLYFLVFIVCESVLGLSLLILLIRSNGNDNMKYLNLILW